MASWLSYPNGRTHEHFRGQARTQIFLEEETHQNHGRFLLRDCVHLDRLQKLRILRTNHWDVLYVLTSKHSISLIWDLNQTGSIR